jgi:hypothetical protein
MTVCAASLFQWNYGGSEPESTNFGPAFIVASDRMMTDQGLNIEYESSRWKAAIFGNTHMVFVAGDFTFLSDAFQHLNKTIEEEQSIDTYKLAVHLSKSFVEVRNSRLERRYLSPLGVTYRDLDALRNESYIRIYEELQREQFGVEAIVVGCSGNQSGLYRLDEFGVVTNHLDIGFLSIGSGGIHSSAHLMRQPYSHHSNYFKSLRATFLAKKHAEVSPGVGTATDIFKITRNQVTKIDDKVISYLERIYNRQRSAELRRADTEISRLGDFVGTVLQQARANAVSADS